MSPNHLFQSSIGASKGVAGTEALHLAGLKKMLAEEVPAAYGQDLTSRGGKALAPKKEGGALAPKKEGKALAEKIPRHQLGQSLQTHQPLCSHGEDAAPSQPGPCRAQRTSISIGPCVTQRMPLFLEW